MHRLFHFLGACVVAGLLLLSIAATEVIASSGGETYIRVPVVPLNVQQGMLFTSTPPLLCIEAHVQGPDALLETLPSLKLTYDLDLSAMGIGFHTVPVQEDCLKLPQGISIVTITPSQIDFRLDEETEKAFPVKVICHGEPAPGYVLANTFAKPAIVMLKGPKYLIEDIQYISTRAIDVTGVSESFKKEITLDLIPYTQMVPTPSPIVAEITVAEEITTRILKDIKVQGRHVSRPFHISPPSITIEVKGPARTLSLFELRNDFNVYINLNDLQPGVFVRRATIELPVDITLIHADPHLFTVTIE
jgi:YbbR domain-containing protein